jgi:hypothetical protein
MAQTHEGISHLISKRASVALTSDPRIIEKMSTLDGMRFDDLFICRAHRIGDSKYALHAIVGRAREAYAIPFNTLKSSAQISLISVCDREEDVLAGYIAFYVFNDAGPGEESIYAFYNKESSTVTMLTAIREDAMNVITMLSIVLPAGKVCCECGGRSAQGEPKLKKCPCKKVRYCSKECQHAHWATHRVCCNRGRAEI